jgi:hypothetical protein
MHGSRRFFVTYSLVVAMVVVALSGVLAGSANAGDTKAVRLSIEIGVTGAPRIRLRTPTAKIWRNEPGKPNRVLWRMYNNRTSHYEISWEFRYDPSKEEATADYFGRVDLECGETRVEVPPEKKPDTPNAVWPYTITAYACAKGMKAQKIATVNARIVWKD